MEGAGAGAGFRKELVSRLLHLHFKDDKTKVSGDALQLMAELLKIFVVGESGAHAPSGHRVPDSFCVFTAGKPRCVFPSFPQGPKLGSPEPVCQKQQSAGCGRPRQKTRSVWMWTSWRRCSRSCSWTSRDLSRG
ncbi:PREDICTED: centromere protein X isoform X1 [Mandrillus leucophaeus]|uniref:Centromere protein X n=1 Tax=Mandrillus leucophaeus TaxID=9568 RepID=A0A2K5YP57_MANLE|nr:PREDICTED: centromere protein X isoform X1 [Mandrillus leucophaeus]